MPSRTSLAGCTCFVHSGGNGKRCFDIFFSFMGPLIRWVLLLDFLFLFLYLVLRKCKGILVHSWLYKVILNNVNDKLLNLHILSCSIDFIPNLEKESLYQLNPGYFIVVTFLFQLSSSHLSLFFLLFSFALLAPAGIPTRRMLDNCFGIWQRLWHGKWLASICLAGFLIVFAQRSTKKEERRILVSHSIMSFRAFNTNW